MGGLADKVLKTKNSSSYNEITQQLYLKNAELLHTNNILALLRKIDVHVLDSRNTVSSLVALVCSELMITKNYPFLAVVTRSEITDNTYFVSDVRCADREVQAGLQEMYLRSAVNQDFVTGIDDLWETGVAGKRNRLGDVFQLAKQSKAFSADLERLGVSHVLVSRLRSNEAVHGLIVVGYAEAKDVTAEEKEFLARISEACGVALDNKLLSAQLQKIAHKLTLSNTKLRDLDETKDDFISMASHQLRTPLTSIKGYLSMVLEGDAGEINETQKKMLGQAFVSSQRMVYLIADLLNVSRLKTGKFIIEAIPTSLADMVSEELDQLVETAAARDITLTYDKPDGFPAIMLDATKTRQVVMNFIDNAIYYTPAGGHIDVQLEETPTSIELRVVDDGIGVPKAEQHHLFTKFYRAGNARKARPDGTGLGLFMAKKVILAQGGSILFESQEGKGSTFGFLFPKKHHTAKLKHLPVVESKTTR